MTNDLIPGELFNVCQFFPDGSYEYVRRFVDIKEALDAAQHYTQNVSAWTGLTSRVIITDSGDSIVFEWLYGRGVVFPEGVVEVQRRNYSK